MIIIEKNKGPKISYKVSGSKITFDDDLSLNLAKREQDWPLHIDICRDVDKELVIGATARCSYVAQIDIPARKYTETTEASEEIEGETVVRKEPIPLSMDSVTLTLWAV
jgi:hypothetical protein